MSKNEQNVIQNLKTLVENGTDNFVKWVKENPEKTSEILKAHNQLFLTEIIDGRILEYEEEQKP